MQFAVIVSVQSLDCESFYIVVGGYNRLVAPENIATIAA